MANANFSLGQVNIVDHLLCILKEVSAPGVEVARQSFAPSHPTTRNVSFTGLNPVMHYLDLRESPDGTALGLLLASFVYDVRNNQIIAERRFYTGGGGGATDPAAHQPIIADPYLDGKTISGVFKEGFRYLKPETHVNKEYDLHAGGGIELIGMNISQDEVIVIEVSYLTNVPSPASGAFLSGVVTLTANTTIDSTHYNKRLRCESSASSRQVHTLPALSSVPEGTPIYFMQNAGNQFQTKILTQSGDLFRYHDFTRGELTFMKGEFLWIEKRSISSTNYWEIVQAHEGILRVGERVALTWKDHKNTKPENGALYDGDDYPRPWYWILNDLPLTHYIIDDAVINPGYVHPAGKEGLFVIHSTQKKFRVPNTQGLSERGLKDFETYNTDATRVYDYPGGVQNEEVGPHIHIGLEGDTGSHSAASSALTGTVRLLVNTLASGGNHAGISGGQTGGVSGSPTENRVKNFGVIYARRF